MDPSLSPSLTNCLLQGTHECDSPDSCKTGGVSSAAVGCQQPEQLTDINGLPQAGRGEAMNGDAQSGQAPESSEQECPLCFEPINQNASYVDPCMHQYCFDCIREWSKRKPECPLCGQSFPYIIHNVRGLGQYDVYHVQTEPEVSEPGSSTGSMEFSYEDSFISISEGEEEDDNFIELIDDSAEAIDELDADDESNEINEIHEEAHAEEDVIADGYGDRAENTSAINGDGGDTPAENNSHTIIGQAETQACTTLLMNNKNSSKPSINENHDQNQSEPVSPTIKID